MEENKKPLVILTGPTAVGKTDLSLQLAEKIRGAIVSADSMQVYRGLDIGSAKLPAEEQKGIPHYLIDVLEPEEAFDVARFQQMAKAAFHDIWGKGMIPVLTGGTGFYIQAAVRDVDFSETEGASSIRKKWEEILMEKGPGYVHAQLAAVDPDAAAAVHEHNVKRVIRALEYYEQTGTQISRHNAVQRDRISPYNTVCFVLNDDRSRLYRQIELRVDEMMRNGLEEEVRSLASRGLSDADTSMKGIGYKEFFPYFRGEYSLDRTVELIKRNTRHYAKRQLTWFRREPDVVWINKPDFAYSNPAMLDFMLRMLAERGVIL